MKYALVPLRGAPGGGRGRSEPIRRPGQVSSASKRHSVQPATVPYIQVTTRHGWRP
jgi:hypothetical protein